jgi:alpha-ribazole phosphatase
MAETESIWIWRHPKPVAAQGRCIGRTDLGVDPRKAKRLAHRIRAQARRVGLPASERVISTSPLRRGAEVGRWLKRWGWRHCIDPRLSECDFGAWDGQRWSEIDPTEITAWTDNFATWRPGGGESMEQLRQRVREVLDEVLNDWPDNRPDRAAPWIVGHAGWINALRTLSRPVLQARDWPAPLRYGQGHRFNRSA